MVITLSRYKAGEVIVQENDFGETAHIPPDFVVRSFRNALIPSRGEDVQVEHPVLRRYAPTFHFHPTLTRMQGSALVGNEVIQMRQTGEKRRLTPPGWWKPFMANNFRSMALWA